MAAVGLGVEVSVQSTLDTGRLLDEVHGRHRAEIERWVRRWTGLGQEAAEEHTEEFIFHLATREALKRYDPERGKIEAWLRGALRFWLLKQMERNRARKRSGGAGGRQLSLERLVEEQELEAPGMDDPGLLNDRSWAAEVLSSAWASMPRDEATDILRAWHERGSGQGRCGKEVAQRYGVERRRFLSLLKRAQRRLRSRLEQELRRCATGVNSYRELREEFLRYFSESMSRIQRKSGYVNRGSDGHDRE